MEMGFIGLSTFVLQKSMMNHSDFEVGRSIVASLPHDEDLLGSIEAFCTEASIQSAVFSLIGAVKSVTLGSYDQNQQVYVTAKREEPLEIVHCTGNVTLKDGGVAVHAHAVLADENGQTVGGHLFSETLVFAGEMFLQELIGPPLERQYDDKTGLYLWRF
jgi:predicted DNA-binding protein with PD1-like motif